MSDLSVSARELADRLAALLAVLESGGIASSAATRYRLEGAIVALEIVNGASVESVVAVLADGVPDPEQP